MESILYLPSADPATVATDLQLVWTSPNHRPFSQYDFQKKLFVKATLFNRKFFNQNNTGIEDVIYQPRLEAFKEAFNEWNTYNYNKKWGEMFFRDELILSFDKLNYQNNNQFCFYATPTTSKYGTHHYKRAYEFRIETRNELEMRADDYIEENICFFSTICILNNLVEGVSKDPISVDYTELAEDNSSGKDYNDEDCPLCFEPLKDDPVKEGGFLGKCGHCVCLPCMKNLVKAKHNNLTCPMCRDDWECYDIVEGIGGEYTEEDIDDLKENEDYDTLLEIVDRKDLMDYVVMYYGWSDVLGENQGNSLDYGDLYYSVCDGFSTYEPADVIEEVF